MSAKFSDVPEIKTPDDDAWSEGAETASLLLSRPLRARVMAYLNSIASTTGATKAEIMKATGASVGTVNQTLALAEERGLLEVKPQRYAEDNGANRYFLDTEKYRQAVHAWMEYSLGAEFKESPSSY